MKERISGETATQSSVQASVMVTLFCHVLISMPKLATLNQSLRSSRDSSRVSNDLIFLPLPHDLTFDMLDVFRDFILFDSGPVNDRIIVMGDLKLLDGLSRATLWLTDGTCKIVPTLYFQFYSIYFQYSGTVNHAAACLTALAYVPLIDVSDTFHLLAESMPRHERMEELLSMFEHTYIRGSRVRGKKNTLNKFNAATEGIARTTNDLEI
ncbi:hypothetical protein RF11_12062 [Thelohanellus kitauei]|uniref:Uncharacterized protein n=1 Tax=Thelohanellus kitauei TaxID=669202 RepID=A0A0C2N4F7_THEKT|nr:hypothetical protein RF11_12062 [Thelohanellus kitauei]